MRRPDQKIYWVWADMLSRCRNPNHRQYKDYGARGITVCDRWENSFETFKRDMGERPEGMTLDRKNNDLGYSPDNCRWATRAEQNSNKRNCIYVDDSGEKITLREYCRRHGLTYRPIVKRIQDRNWPIELAIRTPIGCGKQFHRIPAKQEAA